MIDPDNEQTTFLLLSQSSSAEASEKNRGTLSPHNTDFFWFRHFQLLLNHSSNLGIVFFTESFHRPNAWLTDGGRSHRKCSRSELRYRHSQSAVSVCNLPLWAITQSYRWAEVDLTYAVEARNDGWYQLSFSSHSHFWLLTHGRCNLTSFSSCLWTFRPLVWFSPTRKCI